MRRRLTLTLLSLTGLLLLALEVPLAYVWAMNDYHHFAVGRLNETARLAAVAAPTLIDRGNTADFEARIKEYDRATGTGVLLVDSAGQVVAASRSGLVIDRARWRTALGRALGGERSNIFDYEFNVEAEPLFIAEPVEGDGRVTGAVVTISSTVPLTERIGREVGLFAALAVFGLGGAVAVSMLLSRWIMRPIHRLIRTARLIGKGDYDRRAPDVYGPAEVRELAQAFNQMTDRIVASLEAQRSFVADASHQLRNPLSAMRLRVETLEPLIPRDGQDQFAAALTEVERLSRILDELLSLAQADTTTVPPVRVDVAEVARHRVEAWRPKAERAGVLVVGDCAPLVAAAAPGTLDQVLDVFIDNAVQMAPDGSTITVNCRAADGTIEVHVLDRGPGMNEDERKRAVDRFWRGRSAADGSGLGLAIAAALLRASGGGLRLDARPEGGLDAVAILPVWPAIEDRSRPPAQTDRLRAR